MEPLRFSVAVSFLAFAGTIFAAPQQSLSAPAPVVSPAAIQPGSAVDFLASTTYCSKLVRFSMGPIIQDTYEKDLKSALGGLGHKSSEALSELCISRLADSDQ